MADNGHAGDSEWIQVALQRYEGPLLRYALRITGDVERARDVVQDTFLKLCRENRREQIPQARLAQWLYTVCRNQAFDVRRKERRMSTLSATDQLAGNEALGTPDEEVERQDAASRILELVGELPDNQQEVLSLKFQGGMSYRQISEVTGLSVSYVGHLIHTGIHTVRRRIKASL